MTPEIKLPMKSPVSPNASIMANKNLETCEVVLPRCCNVSYKDVLLKNILETQPKTSTKSVEILSCDKSIVCKGGHKLDKPAKNLPSTLQVSVNQATVDINVALESEVLGGIQMLALDSLSPTVSNVTSSTEKFYESQNASPASISTENLLDTHDSTIVQETNSSKEIIDQVVENCGCGSNTLSPAEDMFNSIHHNNYSDLLSEGSLDSGKGGSDVHTPGGSLDFNMPGVYNASSELSDVIFYKFELPQVHVGKLIGKYGAFVNQIRAKTGAHICVKPHTSIKDLRICTVEGSQTEVDEALEMIRRKFPLYKYPKLTLESVNYDVNLEQIQFRVPVPEALQLHLPQGISCDVIVSSIQSPSCFFLQQPTHPTYTSLSQLDYWMASSYGDGALSPSIPYPIDVGVICAAPCDGDWYRAQIVGFNEEDGTSELKYLDYGGYAFAQTSSLRQIRMDFMTLPFQSQECCLAGIEPVNNDWSEESIALLKNLCNGKLLQVQVSGFFEGIPLVYMFKIEGTQCIMINKELVDHGHGKWQTVAAEV